MNSEIEENFILNSFIEGRNILLHGPAGSGKTFQINKLKQFILSQDNDLSSLAIMAPTGTASFHIGGNTIHSEFGIGIFTLTPAIISHIEKYDDYLENPNNPELSDSVKYLAKYDEIIKNLVKKSRFNNTNLKYIFIDEISMVGVTILRIMDGILRSRHGFNKNLPFGGVQCVFSGDFYQLQPVKDNYCCFSKLWDSLNLVVVNMNNNRRFKNDDNYFSFILRIRQGLLLQSDKEFLESRFKAYENKDYKNQIVKPLKLYSRNNDVNEINVKKLERLDSDLFVYEAKDNVIIKMKGLSKSAHDSLQNKIRDRLDEISEIELRIKVGAQIIFTRNYDISLGLTNGRMAKILEIKDNKHNPIVTIQTVDGLIFEIKKMEFKLEAHNYVATRNQFPFKLGWAITTHKSQGMTLDTAIVEVNAFCAGGSYVAISRVNNKNNLYISKLFLKKIYADKKIIDKFNNQKAEEFDIDCL